jgi:serine/threonine-protein kinase
LFPQIFGKYVLERPLAVGGMARVFLATLRGAGGFEKKLVVKQIRAELATDEAFVRRFVAEAKTTVELSHPNIVPVYELGAEEGVYYLAMELCDGVTLAELLEQTGRLAPAEGAYVGIEICRALDYAHRKARVIHRDVTPRNVLIDEEGAVRLIDFGIAAPAYSGAREIFGSPGHMPPEQLTGQQLGPATDVFAVAALLVEAWSNRAPFRRQSPEACERALLDPVPPASSIDRALASLDVLIESALSRDPERRPQSAEDLSRPLRRFLDDTDFGDIARRLGARVRATREAGSRAPVGDEAGALIATASKVTHTFAARTSETPPAPPSERARGLDQATRRMGEGSRRPSQSDRRTAGETSPGSRRAAVRWLVVAAAAVGLATVIGWQPWRHVALVKEPEVAAAVALPPTAPLATALPLPVEPAPLTPESPFPPAKPASAPPEPALGPAAAPAKSAFSPSSPLATSPSASSRAESLAHLRITATPRAAVEIDGHPRGATPLADLALSPGAHLLRLNCDALGEAVSQNLRLEPGESLVVSGDFTGVRGRILVRRGPASP